MKLPADYPLSSGCHPSCSNAAAGDPVIAVVTGSTGFIGSHLVDALLARGADVRALYRPETSRHRRDPRAEPYEVDLLDDRALRSSKVWHDATHVFHLAGVTRGRRLAHFRAGNVDPTVNLLAALAAYAGGTPRIVLVSSQAAAGPASAPDAPVRESDSPRPVEPYGQSKLEAEQALLRYPALGATVVRPAAVYGPRDRDFLHAFRQAAGRIALFAAPRDQLFSIVHVSDLVRAILLAGDEPAARGHRYFVGNDEPTTWRALYAAIAAAAGAHPRTIQLPLGGLRIGAALMDAVALVTGRTFLASRARIALANPRWWLCDSSRARTELGWRAEVALNEGVRDTHLSYLSAGWMRAPRADAAPSKEMRV